MDRPSKAVLDREIKDKARAAEVRERSSSSLKADIFLVSSECTCVIVLRVIDTFLCTRRILEGNFIDLMLDSLNFDFVGNAVSWLRGGLLFAIDEFSGICCFASANCIDGIFSVCLVNSFFSSQPPLPCSSPALNSRFPASSC